MGEEILTAEGFLTFYQGQEIPAKLQEQIDVSARLWIFEFENRPLDTTFMPLTKMTAIEWQPILDWMVLKYDSVTPGAGPEVGLFQNGIFYEELTDEEVDNLYVQGADLFGNEDIFKAGLYE